MAMWGIGLGGFAKGLESGIGLGEKMGKMAREAKLQGSRDDAAKAVEAEVAAGRIKPGDVNAILRFTHAKTAPALIDAGRSDEVLKLGEWMQRDDTRRAVTAWGEGMLAAHAGDAKGALDKFISAGRIRGYGADFQIGDPQAIEGGGFQVDLTNKAGKPFTKVFRNAQEIIEFGAAFNPEWAGRTFLEQERTRRANSGRGPVGPAPIAPQTQPGIAPLPQPQAAAASPLYATATMPNPPAQQQQQQQPSFTERWLGASPAPQQSAIPRRPAGIPPDAGYSSGQGLWFTRDGKAFDQNGREVKR